MVEQHQFGFVEAPYQNKTLLTSPIQKFKSFIPSSIDNGLHKDNVHDHSMLWLRSLSKSTKNYGSLFIFHQFNEIKFKRNEYDQTTIVRHSILKKLINSLQT